MKILLTGGGTGGHFYPLIAIAEQLNILADTEKIINMKLYFMSDKEIDNNALIETGIKFIKVPTGKMRTYSSNRNFFDIFKTISGAIWGTLRVFSIYPDVIISKGGYGAFPAVFAGRILRIPIIVHESDSAPGRLNLWASKFATKIAVSYLEAGEKFPKEKTAWVGQPIRRSILEKAKEGGHEYFKLDTGLKTIFVLGGSLGAQIINNVIIESLPDLVEKYQIIHQTGKSNFEEISMRANLVLEKSKFKHRYIPLAFLNPIQTKMAAGSANLIISRAGSAIFEIASWGIPSIIVPITNSNGDHQRKNAFTYARAGACEVMEESNLQPHLFTSEIEKLLNNNQKLEQMEINAKKFATPNAAFKIAKVAIDIAIAHD